ncbi:aldo/keto reductase [Streptomyces griseus]|uniref:aldo/keto reductase n=1 Tax=Streptomyces griseus TaxID=1911 RepID=UPI0037D18380
MTSARLGPGPLSPLTLLALQRAVGNRAVSRMVEESRHQHGAGCGHRQDTPAVQRSYVHDVLRGSGQPMAAPLQQEMEGRLGADFSDVRLHTGTTAQRSAAEIGARAYTSGNHVVLGDDGGDRHTLAHELTHVIQQRQGPVAGTDNGSGLRVSDPSDRFEREAEANARQALSGPVPAQRATGPTTAAPSAQKAEPMVARMMAEEPTADKPWPVFGVDGRSREQLNAAVSEGYRRFDTAESYNNIHDVAEALRGLPRNSYELLYKFDVKAGESPAQLTDRLRGVAALFNGSLDSLVIHNLDVNKELLTAAWQVLGSLKGDGVAHQIGLGNLGEADVGLLAELGGVDVVENSVESVLLSEKIQDAISKSGAHLYYYDVIRTARQMNLDPKLADDMNALIYMMTSASTHTSMITSSGSAENRTANLTNFRGGPSHPDFDGDEQYEGMGKVSAWQKQQSSGQTNESAFTLAPGLHDWLADLSEHSADLRGQVAAAAQQAGQSVTQAFITEWLVSQGQLTATDLESVKVPSRVGLKRRYIGMALPEVLGALLGVKNCDWKWSIELVQLMVSDIATWDNVLRHVADQIVQSA